MNKGDIMTTNVTAKNFASKLNGVIKSATSMRDNLQELLVFGLEHYKENGDTTYLTKCVNSCISVKALPTNLMKEYIKAHANVMFAKAKDGSMVFKKLGKEVEVNMPDVKWYEFNDAHQAKQDVHPLVQLKSWMTRTKKAIEEGLVKDEDEQKTALNAIAQVEALLA